MTRTPWFLSFLAALSLSTAQAASLLKGQVLYERGKLEDAKHALVDVMTSDSSDDDKAGALSLLGTIALKQKRYPIAARMWSDLIERYPGSAEAREARTKLPTIPNSVQYSKVRVDSPEGYAPPEPSQGVRVTGTGADLQYAGQAVSQVATLLDSKGVRVVRANSSDAAESSMLVLTMSFGRRDVLEAHCYSNDGRLVWSETASSLLGLRKASVAEGLVDRIKEKIEPHVGDACLPKR
jgi:tetratricopeptide (TPR) repeat protein